MTEPARSKLVRVLAHEVSQLSQKDQYAFFERNRERIESWMATPEGEAAMERARARRLGR